MAIEMDMPHLYAEIVALHALTDERERRYQQRFEDQGTAVNAALDAAKEAVGAALAAAEKAVSKAEHASEKRFDSVNEFRQQLADQAATFLPRKEAEASLDAVNARSISAVAANTARIGALEITVTRMVTKDEVSALERITHTLMTRREVESAIEAVNEKIRAHNIEANNQRDLVAGQLNQQALALERANAAGQSIYILRSEATTNAKALDDKIATVLNTASSQNENVLAATADLRAQLADQNSRFMPRAESETRTMGNTERLREIEIRMQGFPNREETAVALAAADAKFAAAIASMGEKSATLADRMAALDLRLTSRLDLSSGKGEGISAMWGYVVGGIGLFATMIGIFFALSRATG